MATDQYDNDSSLLETASEQVGPQSLGVSTSEPYQNLPPDCTICQKIMGGLLTPFSDAYRVDIPPAEVDLHRKCSAHEPLLAKIVERIYRGHPEIADEVDYRVLRLSLIKEENDVRLSIEIYQTEVSLSSQELILVKKDSSSDHPGRGRILDVQWIDSCLPRIWKECCKQTHGGDCENPFQLYRISKRTPTWLIDVRNRCLVPGKPDMIYVALSYVWGGTESLNLKMALLPQLQQPNALSDFHAQIPETIRNAIDTVLLLDEEFLWVDSLCIVHDEESTKVRDLKNMAEIYANSTATIVAASGENSAYGLRGFEGVSQPRELSQMCFEFGDVEKLIAPQFQILEHLPATTYFGRGWTFQEYFFSKRRLIFEQGGMRWECNCSYWWEDVVNLSGDAAKLRINLMEDVFSGFPSSIGYSMMLRRYNGRTFTHVEDVLPALTGLLSLLCQKYAGGFLWGLPEMYFDASLNWRPSPLSSLSRKVSSGLSSASTSLEYLPSWSWMGWKGHIECNWCGNEDFLKTRGYFSTEETIPIVEWHTAAKNFEGEKRRIHPKFLHEKHLYKDHLNQVLPHGWTRHDWDVKVSPGEQEHLPETGISESPPPEGCGTCFYTHEDVPGFEFWYPIPIADPNADIALPPQTQYLFCNTHRAWLHASLDEEEDRSWDQRIWLRDHTGAWAGVLLLHNEADLTSLTTDPPAGPRVELVAISRGQAPKNTEFSTILELDPHHEELPKTPQMYEFYNVLWVEWNDGIAYRRASGRVLREMWEKIPELEPVALVLG